MVFCSSLKPFILIPILLQALLQVGTVAGTPLESALKQINEFGRNHALGGALLTESENLNKITKSKWNNIDRNEKEKVLQARFKQSDANEPVEVGLEAAILKFVDYTDLTTRYVDSNWNESIVLSVENQNNEYKIASDTQIGNQAQLVLGKIESQNKLVAVKRGNSTLIPEANCYKAIKHHPNLVQLLDDGPLKDDPGSYAIVLELMSADLVELKHLCGNQLSLKTIIIVIRQMLNAVKHIHEKNFVHQNLQVGSVMAVLSEGKSLLKLGYLENATTYREVRGFENQSTKNVGALKTKSIFAHNGSPPRPRDDVMSMLFMFMELVSESLPWDPLCDKIERIHASGLSKEKSKEIETLSENICKLKETHGQEFAETYPELGKFVSHVFDLQLDEIPNYLQLDTCLVELMDKHGICDDGIFDWDTNLHMLLHDHDVLKLGVAHQNSGDGYEFVFRFKKFYACLLTDIEKLCRIVELTDDLNREARRASNPEEQHNPPIAFKLTVDENKIEDIKLAHFRIEHVLSDLLRMESMVQVGFGYYYNNSSKSFIVTMLLNTITCQKQPIPETKPMNIAAEELLRVWENLENHMVYTQFVNCSSRKLLFSTININLAQFPQYILEMMSNNYLLEFGYAWNVKRHVWNRPFEIVIVYTFRQNFNFGVTFLEECKIRNLTKLSWSVDEIKFHNPNENLIFPSSSSSSSNKLTPSRNNETIQSLILCKVYSVDTNFKVRADKEIITGIFDNMQILDTICNLRIHWTPMEAGYKMMVLNDTYFIDAKNSYERDALKEIPKEKLNPNDLQLPCSSTKFNQLANDLALQHNLDEEKITTNLQPHGNGLMVYAIKLLGNDNENVDERISRSVGLLTEGDSNPDLRQFTIYDVSTISFGYTVTSNGSVKSVAIFETYCREALDLINAKRFKMGREKLVLHQKNYAFAQEYKENYVGKGKFFLGSSCTSSAEPTDIRKPLAMEKYNGETRKEALTSFVLKILAKEKGALFDMVTSNDSTKIIFVIFQSRTHGKYKIDLKLYGKEPFQDIISL